MTGGTAILETAASLSDRIDQHLTSMSELNRKAAELREDTEAQIAALRGTPPREIEHPQVEVDAAQATDRAIDSVRQVTHRINAELRAAEEEIRKDPRWSKDYADQRIEELRHSAAAEAEAVAAQAWTRAQLAEAQLTEQLQQAERRVNEDVNSIAVRALAEDYRSQIELMDTGDSIALMHYISEMIDAAEASGDRMRLRAVRVAVPPTLSRLHSSGEGTAAEMSRDLMRRARGMLKAERADADRIAHQLRQVYPKRDQLRAEIERLEAQATGKRPPGFAPSPWQRRILGITPESMGGGVMTKQQAAVWDSTLGRK